MKPSGTKIFFMRSLKLQIDIDLFRFYISSYVTFGNLLITVFKHFVHFTYVIQFIGKNVKLFLYYLFPTCGSCDFDPFLIPPVADLFYPK